MEPFFGYLKETQQSWHQKIYAAFAHHFMIRTISFWNPWIRVSCIESRAASFSHITQIMNGTGTRWEIMPSLPSTTFTIMTFIKHSSGRKKWCCFGNPITLRENRNWNKTTRYHHLKLCYLDNRHGHKACNFLAFFWVPEQEIGQTCVAWRWKLKIIRFTLPKCKWRDKVEMYFMIFNLENASTHKSLKFEEQYQWVLASFASFHSPFPRACKRIGQKVSNTTWYLKIIEINTLTKKDTQSECITKH